jgi:glycosyltransferase involved in cell wall biosynthesis
VRVLVVTTDFPPHRLGGYELQCAATVADLRAHGHVVHVLTSAREGAPADTDPDVTRELVRFPAEPAPRSRLQAARDEERSAAALRRALDRTRPDVVSLWRLGELSMSLVPRVVAAGVPAVGMVCDPWMQTGPGRDPWCAGPPRLDGVRWLVVSEALRRSLGLHGARVVHAGIDLAAFPPRPAEPPWRGRLLFAGRLSRLKGLEVAVRAAAALGDGVTLDVVGEGDPVPFASLAPPGRVRFRGPAAEMAPVYAAADAVLFPSTWDEPFGLVPLEAMACGVPVVASGTGGSAEVVRDGVNALVAPPGDVDALADAVRTLSADGALRARLRAGGLRTAARFPAARSFAAIREELEAAARRPVA